MTSGDGPRQGDGAAPAAVRFSLDGRELDAAPGETILQAARRAGVAIPHLCYRDGLRAEGNCRACMVEIAGERGLAPACCRTPQPGLQVRAASERARTAQRLVLELLVAETAGSAQAVDSELTRWCAALGVGAARFAPRAQPAADASHPAITVDLGACIQCTRCVRACREVQVNDVIGYAGRGAQARIVFDLGDALGASSCVGCGECVQACPTGALAPAGAAAQAVATRAVDSVCPYCGVGCQLRYHVADGRIVRVEGRDGPANHGRLCVKGRFGFDYVRHPERLTVPLVRRPGVPKGLDGFDPAAAQRVFREADWDEALALAAGGLAAIRDVHGGRALAGFGSAKGSNEEAYLFQKLVRTGFGSNNVDHCTRLCHASSVAALLEGIGSGAVSNPVADVAETEVIVVIGANPTVNHPVAASFMKQAVRAGKTLILMDPRRTELARHARYVLQFRPDTDVAMLNALLHAIIDEGLVDARFVAERTEDFERLRANVAGCSPEAMAPVCGIPAATLREVARVYAGARAAMIFWGMGVSQHVHGTDNARCLIALALASGQIGRPGTGLHPLRGQNNVQGASDAGLIPMVFPDYQRVDDPAARARFEALWGVPLDPQPGLTVVEIMHAILRGEIRGMYILGENPAMSDPNLHHARAALAALEHLVVQDLFLTETAAFADVVLPASACAEKTGTFTNTDRRVQLGRQAIDPPGQARQDLWIIQQMARRLGLAWDYAGPAAVYAELRRAMPSIAGIAWERLEREHAVTYPCASEADPGRAVLFGERFPTASGRARFVPARLLPAAERPDADYPWVLLTGRQLEHWHTGSMTRRARVLDALEPVPVVTLHPVDLAALGLAAGARVRLTSRRGELVAQARPDPGLRRGEVFMAFCYVEAAVNLLTIDALDPYAKIPEFKYCAVRVDAA
ncbi:NAD-dependent formate dehydrogenase catalytic subunit /NAD-dependent formate dehydrogenase iron-sulfur protein [Plasticicumulans lactativorans]|uniref:NADH-quinone oxidoreductase subunit G n=1 Tax=Plasticicumulans lactativorans TaxID=1133106 RepID=A0A4R2L799_9GAMM|nr:formate dehydrogenase subunit alpha [Plasticicumulans lactativorans]TCO82817.1 NAD-dependent formate dehydrogenase catalytic subunit /NAD-dependent formate dehydrogenase iron-sulfur protein [Plasticicumulans lactativorans]